MSAKNGRASVGGIGVGRPTGRFRASARQGACPPVKPAADGSAWWQQIEYPANWSEIRAQVLKRDNYTCKQCGLYRPPPWHSGLHVHHLTSGNGRSHKPKDLTTVCSGCHKDEHPHMG